MGSRLSLQPGPQEEIFWNREALPSRHVHFPGRWHVHDPRVAGKLQDQGLNFDAPPSPHPVHLSLASYPLLFSSPPSLLFLFSLLPGLILNMEGRGPLNPATPQFPQLSAPITIHNSFYLRGSSELWIRNDLCKGGARTCTQWALNKCRLLSTIFRAPSPKQLTLPCPLHALR